MRHSFIIIAFNDGVMQAHVRRLELDGQLVTAFQNDILVKQGDTDSDMFFVVSGTVTMTVTDHAKRECSLYQVCDGLMRWMKLLICA